MIFRYLSRGLDLLKINIVVLMFLPSSTGKQNFHPVNSCTDITLKEIPVEVFQSCSEADKTIHCLPDENNNLGLSCFAVTWISEAKCPSYNSYQGNLDEKDCSTDHNGECPHAQYKSPLSVTFTGCYIKELIRAKTTTPSITTETMTTKTPTSSNNPSSDPTTDDSIIAGKRSKTNQNDDCECGNGCIIALFIISSLTIVLIVAAGVFIRSKLCAICKEKIKKALCQFRQACAHNDPPLPNSHATAKSNTPMIEHDSKGGD